MAIRLFVSAILFTTLFGSGRTASGIVNHEQCGNRPEAGVYPWVVAIYDTKRSSYICTGTLVSEHHVLTAAHCVTDSTNNNVREPGDFQLAVGKVKRTLEPSEPHQQLLQVKRIAKPDGYMGQRTLYSEDIAIIQLEKKAILGNYVRTACLDPDFAPLPAATNGTVVAWGLDPATNLLSERPFVMNFRIIDRVACLKQVSDQFVRYVSLDKQCAVIEGGRLNRGFGGSGMVYDVRGKLYLGGITSVMEKDSTSGLFLATALDKHKDWIRNNLQ